MPGGFSVTAAGRGILLYNEPMQIKNITVLGTGIMGAALAKNLAAAGFAVTVWNRTAASADRLAHLPNISVEHDLAAAVTQKDAVITMLFDGAAVTEVMQNAPVSPGTIWLQMTTVGISDTAALAQLAQNKELVFYDSPVSGTRGPAEAGKLIMLCAGPDQEAVQPVLDAVGARTVWLGNEPGAATKLKLIVNSWVIALNNAAGELVSLTEGLGLNFAQVEAVIDGGVLDSPFMRIKADLVKNKAYDYPHFGVDTSSKDAQLILAAAQEAGVSLHGLAAHAQRLKYAATHGHEKSDMSAAVLASFEQQES